MAELTHIDSKGDPRMVDVGGKADTEREAVAEAWVTVSAEALEAIERGTNEKGDVLAVAQLAGITGAKRTADIIPLCHPIPIDGVDVEARVVEGRICVQASVRTHWRTGVEMEALTAVTSAALTVYDMCKAVDRGVRIDGVRLLSKRGGRTGDWTAPSS